MHNSIKNRGVLITGAGRGIGKRLALGFAAAGAHVGLLARSKAELDLAKLEIELIFTAIADAMPDIAKAGDQVRFRSGWINGIKRLPVTYRP